MNDFKSNFGDKEVKVQDDTKVVSPDFNTQNLDLYNQAMTAVMAGLAYTSKRYMEIDNPNTATNPEKGTFAYDNNKSIHFTS